MKIRILKSIASARWSYMPGQVVDIEDSIAEAWIQSGIAIKAEDEVVEEAVIEDREKALLKRRKSK